MCVCMCVYVCKETYYNEVAPMILEADKHWALQGEPADWGLGMVQTPAARAQESGRFHSSLKVGEPRCLSGRRQYPLSPGGRLFHSGDWARPAT